MSGNGDPTVRPLGRAENEHGFGAWRFRIEGGEISPEWQPRENQAAWCEFTVWDESDRLGSYGGEVWPTAWPQFFQSIPGGRGGVALTGKGRNLINLILSMVAESP